MLEPKEGLLTFRAEGNNTRSSLFYSRIIHWPGKIVRCGKSGAGVTIGRGYDMKHRSPKKIIGDLTYAGIPLEKARQIATGAGISHCNAANFVRDKKASITEISELQQIKLFELDYNRYINESIRLYNLYKKTDSVSWDNLHPVLKEVFIDMRYQGVLKSYVVSIFGLNNKGDVINLIKKTPALPVHEAARGRVNYIKVNMR